MDNTKKRKIVRNFVIGYLVIQVLSSRIFRLLVLASGRNYERHERTYVPASYFSGL